MFQRIVPFALIQPFAMPPVMAVQTGTHFHYHTGTENAASLWEVINETHSGTEDDPIPYDGNMALTAGLYYTQSGKTYLCNRDTGNPVYHALSELVGLYVEVTE